MSPFIAEIVGTFLLMLLGNGVVANVILNQTKGQNSGWIVITTGWALAVYVAVLVAGPYSGAHINPAVTVSLAVAGKFEWASVPMYIGGQFLGAMLGALVVWIINIKHYEITDDPGIKEATFCTSPAIKSFPVNFLTELVGTFVLILAVLCIAGPDVVVNNGDAVAFGLGSLGALPVALVVWSIGLSLGGLTGYAINPARDLGPRIVHAILPIKNKSKGGWDYAWVPVIGPVVGGSLAALFYMAFL